MPTITTTLTTVATFSDDNLKRYLLRKTWDENKPKLAIIMLVPSETAGIELDNTTLLVLNNASRLGYGGVDVLNLFATLNDFSLKETEDEDTDNLNAIVQSVQKADIAFLRNNGKSVRLPKALSNSVRRCVSVFDTNVGRFAVCRTSSRKITGIMNKK